MTDHDLLIRLSEQMECFKLLMTNHLHHHMIYSVTMLGGLISTVTAFVLYWLKARAFFSRKK